MKITVLSAFIFLIPALSIAGQWACPDGKTYPVALTFDDGPSVNNTPKVLDVLKKNKIQATFFVSASRLDAPRDALESYQLMNRMRREGHVIGSHTYNHLHHAKEMTLEEAEADIAKAKALLRGYENPILRLPYGDGAFPNYNSQAQARNDAVMDLVKRYNYQHVLWDIDTNDWNKLAHGQIVPTMMREICLKHGGIILMHDIQTNTAAHLQEWIDIIRSEGHVIVPLSHFVPAAKYYDSNPKEDCPDCTSKQKKKKDKGFLHWLDKRLD